MTSTNDSTILAMLSRYPDMSAEEADSYIAKIEHEENIPICHAVIGRISRNQLDDNAVYVFDEFQRWSKNRTERTKKEQWNARIRQKETRLSLKMNQLFEKGIIDEQTLLLYGISGQLPEVEAYMAMSPEEKEAVWTQRMEARFGPHWRNRTRTVTFTEHVRRNIINWKKEGF